MGLFYATLDSPVGLLRLAATESGLCKIAFPNEGEAAFQAWLARHIAVEPQYDAQLLRDALIQLREYFSRLRRRFELPLDLRGTPFQRAVWQEVAAIPYDTTVTYGQIAQRMGRQPGAARAVGTAVGANPLPIVIPCHRVVGADGSLVGFGGGLEAKAALLRLEGLRI